MILKGGVCADRSTAPLTVLIVDDDEDILKMASLFLKAKGLSVIAASSPFGVTSLVRRHRPAVVVLDVMMPALDGSALAGLIDGKPAEGHGPTFLFYSALEEAQLCELSTRVPRSTYVCKTDGLAALYRAILMAARMGTAR